MTQDVDAMQESIHEVDSELTEHTNEQVISSDVHTARV